MKFTLKLNSEFGAKVIQETVEKFDGSLPDKWPVSNYNLPISIEVDAEFENYVWYACGKGGVDILSFNYFNH